MDRDRFVEITIGHEVKQRTKCFMLHDVEIWFSGRQAWLHITVAGNSEAFPAVKNFTAFIFQSLDRMLHHVDGILVDQWAHHCFPIERIPNRQRFVCSQKFASNLGCDRFVHDHASRGGATLPGCPDRAEEDRLRGHIEIRAGRDDERVVAAELHDCSTEAAMNSFRNIQAHVHRAGG